MNPSGSKTQSDRMKVREAYLANLKAQQRNLDKTGDAMKIMATTGQPPIAPQDTRSISEKFKDVETLKVSLRKLLSGITDGAQVNEIMNVLSNREVEAISLLFADIEREMKQKYPRGVLAPIFIEYIRGYIKDYEKNVGLASANQNVIASELRATREMLSQLIPSQAVIRDLIQAISSAPQSSQRADALAAAQQLGAVLPDPNDIATASSLLNQSSAAKLADLTDAALQEVPTSAQVQGLTKDITNALRTGNVRAATNILDDALQYLKLQQEEVDRLKEVSDLLASQARGQFVVPLEIPEVAASEIAKIARLINSKPKNVKTKVGEVTDSKGRIRPQFTNQIVMVEKANVTENDMRVAQMVSDLDRADYTEIVELNPSKKEAISYYEYLERRDNGDALPKAQRDALNALSRDEIIQLIVSDKEGGELTFTAAIKQPLSSKAAAAQASASQTGGVANLGGASMRDLAEEDMANLRTQSVNNFELLSTENQIDYIFQLQNMGHFDRAPAQVQQEVGAFLQAAAQGSVPAEAVVRFYQELKTVTGMGMRSKMYKMGTAATKGGKKIMFGNGLVSKTKQTFPDKIDFESGVPADKSYIPFGRYVINKHKLGDGKLMIKTIKGGAIPKLPTLGVSPALGGIIKKMIGGAMPTYNEMKSLSEEEQNTLYKVFKLSQVDKADFLPSPDKSKEEEEMNRFMILKGQFQSGNDNKELIKEFKLMLLKFINGGKIPKSQGMDIVCDLIALGY